MPSTNDTRIHEPFYQMNGLSHGFVTDSWTAEGVTDLYNVLITDTTGKDDDPR